MIARITISALLPILALAGCSGSGGVHVSPSTVVPSAPPVRGTATVTVTISIPKRSASTARTPRFVSPSAQSIRVDVYPVTAGVIAGSPSTTSLQDLTASSPGCSGGSPNVCAVTLSVPAGIAAFGIKLYAGLGQTGSVLSQLDPTVATERTIVAGTSNVTLPLVLGGVPASIVVSAPATTFTGGSLLNVPYTVVARDAAGNIIVGNEPYETPITPTTSDPSAITFSPASVTSPTTPVTLQFNGTATTTVVTASASVGAFNAPAVSFAFTPAPLTATCSGGCLSLPNGSLPYTLTLSEAGYTGSVTIGGSGTSCNFFPASTGTMSNGTGTIKVYPNPAGGNCTSSATDRYSQSASSYTTFVAAGPPALGGCASPPKPADPFGGGLPLYLNSGCAQVFTYGSYTYYPYDSPQNPPNQFALAIYADQTSMPVRTTIINGCRYVASVSINSGPANVVYTGQSGFTATVSFAALDP